MKTPWMAAAVAFGIFVSSPVYAAKIVINNVDPPRVGFNDRRPAKPVGGNPGTTIGQQRLIAYQRALDLWGSVLKSNVVIKVQGSFAPLFCTATGGTLAQAGALSIFSDFPNAPLAGHWYGGALADAIAGEDLDPGFDDIVANFNGDVGKPGCIEGPGFYYGLDNKPAPGQIDFLNVFMHEVAHGLGFQNFADVTTGELILDMPDVYMANTLDLDRGLKWNQFTTPEEIVASTINTGRVVWSGPRVTANAPLVLGPLEGVRITGNVNRELETGTADFGPPASAANLNGDIVLVKDRAGLKSTDGCEAIANRIVGKVALIDRGNCAFLTKVQNAQNAGAKSVLIANNVSGTIGLGGSDPSITIPTLSVGLEDGNLIKASLPGVALEYFVDPSRRAGVAENYVRLYAPGAVSPGSSISHWDTVASPNLLLEPFDSDSLRAASNLDLTPSLMQDIGWKLETLKFKTCDTGTPNALPDGKLLSVAVQACRTNPASPVGVAPLCVNDIADRARRSGYITLQQQLAIVACSVIGN